MSNIIAIVGRPNVGKSSLFNRITSITRKPGRPGIKAIVDDTPGVTRDRLYGDAEWRGRSFYIVDTGGIFGADADSFSKGIRAHVDAAIDECDAILFMIDGRDGVTSSDMEIANMLRRSNKPVLVAVNKLDDMTHDDRAVEAFELGFEHVVGISAVHRRNLEELLDTLFELLPEFELNSDGSGLDDYDPSVIRLAIVGKPNVGKSSMLNRLVGAERSLVSPVAGTTRDPVDTEIIYKQQEQGLDQKFRLVDTAGLRRRARMDTDLEYYSFVRTMAAVDRCDVALLLMDAADPCTDQDKRIAAHVIERGKGLVIILNKWDLVSGAKSDPELKSDKPGDKLTKRIREDMPFLDWAPILFTSAQSGRGVQRIFPMVLAVNENRQRRIATNVLNRLMRDVLAFDRLPSNRKGRTLRVYYCSQTNINPPTFVFFVNEPELAKANTAFENHVRHELRNLADFTGTPLRLFWRGRDSRELDE